MKLGIIAGNRLLPILLLKNIKEKNKDLETVAICFKEETSPLVTKYAHRTYWIKVGQLLSLKEIIKRENLKACIMAGQITPQRIFKRKEWDGELHSLVKKTQDFRPHSIFSEIIRYLENEGVVFFDSTMYLKEYLSSEGVMNGLDLDEECKSDIDFGVRIISRFVELDIGQTVVVKKRSVVALESLEGTDRTILRAYRLAGRHCTVLKFSKINQDLRFDVPVVGISTLGLLKRTKALSLVLEKGKVIILEKERFLSLAKKWKIPIIGREKVLT